MTDRHHNAPPLSERLDMDYEALAKEITEAAALVPADLAPIANDNDAAGYVETAKVLRDLVGSTGRVEKVRKVEKDQILKDGRTIDGFFAGIADPGKTALDRVMGEINRYQRAKLDEERRREEEERKAAALFDEAPPATVAVKDAARITTIGAKATASTRWVHEVVDPANVPRQYLMVNEAAIKAAIAGGVRMIPGVRIYETVRTAIR